MRILKRLIVSPAVYPRFLEIARGLSAIAELLVGFKVQRSDTILQP